MAIKKIKISNFKSFNDMEVELGNFNVLVGANASGKSNFIQIFKFLRDIVNHGLENAISLQGNGKYLQNTTIESSKELSLKIEMELEEESYNQFIKIRTKQIEYELSIRFNKKGGYKITRECSILRCDFIELEENNQSKFFLKDKKLIGSGEIIVNVLNETFDLEFELPKELKKEDVSNALFYQSDESPRQKTLLEDSPFQLFHYIPRRLSEFLIYDFNSKTLKSPATIFGKKDFEEDGSNIALVLKNIIENKRLKRQFLNILQDLLPFVSNIKTSDLADNSLHFDLKETFSKEQFLPASFLSDGTVSATALVIALFFDERLLRYDPVIIFEEPEKHIHPSIISKMMQMFKEASEQKQIIFTTHNPEIVKHTNLENLLFISRDEEGFSTMTRPAEKDEVKTFLEHEIGIEDLFTQDLLGV